MTIRNAQFNPDGTLVSTRLTPRNAGFGAANQARNRTADGGIPTNRGYNRTIQAQVRFQF